GLRRRARAAVHRLEAAGSRGSAAAGQGRGRLDRDGGRLRDRDPGAGAVGPVLGLGPGGRQDGGGAGGEGRSDADDRDRPPVVVGGALPRHDGGDGERDPHPHQHAHRRAARVDRRDPQLLGAGAQQEDGHAAGAPEPPPALLEPGGGVPRAVRRVLRAPAREHVARGGGAAAGPIPGVARERGEARERAREPRVHVGAVRELPHHPRHGGARHDRAGPHARGRPQDPGRADDPERPGAHGSVDLEPAGRQAGRADAGARAEPAGGAPARDLPRGAALMASVAQPASVQRLERIWAGRPGVLGWLTTTDHKRIGLLYLFACLVFFAAGGVEALLIRTQLIHPNNNELSPAAFNQVMTMHGVTMIFLFVIPISTGAFGNYLLPLMIGARDMAFPRLNALSFWIFAGSGIFMYTGLALGNGPNAGWFDYVPLASRQFNPGQGIDFYALGLIFNGISTTAAAINFIVTIFKLRAPGMSLNRMPLFAYAFLAVSLALV